MSDARANFAFSTVATAPSPATSGTTLTVATGHGARFPTAPFNVTVSPVNGTREQIASGSEIVRVTNKGAGDNWTITRAQESTSARSIIVGDEVALTPTKKMFDDIDRVLTVTQSSHGFAVGDVLRHNGTDYVKAKADTAGNAEVVGIVSNVVDANNFQLLFVGSITGLSGLTAGSVYFLDPSTAGALTATEPTTTGQVSKPLLIATSTTAGHFFNFRGEMISGAAATDGWIDDSAETWTFASATTFTISGDKTAKYTTGTRIKLTQTTIKYFVVVSSAFASGTTTVTVTGGSDYSVANAAISANAHSYQANPQGYPGWFNYTPTYTGFSVDPSGGSHRFAVNGRVCTVIISPSSNGTSNATNFQVSAPIVSAGDSGYQAAFVRNNGANQAAPGLTNLPSASSTIDVYRDGTALAWTNSGGKLALFELTYQI